MSDTFLVRLLGIIRYKNKILIVKRKNDPFVKELKWCFPSGSLESGKYVEECLKEKVKKKIGLNISVKQLLFTRVPRENKNFLLIYFYCESKWDKVSLKGEFVESKWIEPKEYKKYFTTSVDKRLVSFFRSFN